MAPIPQIKLHQNQEHFDSMIIGAGHSILAGYVPPSIPSDEFSEKFYQWSKMSPDTISQFGFWGGDIDYNTYYPGLSAEELKPQDSEFIEPMFRLLSATIVSKNYNPTDFGSNGVLKASMRMLLGQTVNCDHETNIGNAIGSVSKVVWQDAYKDGNFIIPAGINGVLKIDGKANPRIARGILMEPPSIHSNSVTVQFKWDKSHPGMDDNEFYSKLGTYDANGNMVRRMVTEVVRYLETSLVSHGADSFAQKIGSDGKIINPEFAKRTWNSFAEYQKDEAKVYAFTDIKLLNEYNTHPSNNETTNLEEQQPKTNNNMDFQSFIAAILAANVIKLAEGQEQTPENIIAALKAYGVSQETQIQALTSEKASLTEKVNNLNAQVASLTDMANIGKAHIASLRDEAIANYKKLKGNDVEGDPIITMLNNETIGLQTLEALNKEYMAQLEEKFPLTCAKCGSHDVSRAASVKEDPEEKKPETSLSENPADIIKGMANKALMK